MSEQQPIIVYGVMSPNVAKVVIMLEELELPYILRYVSLFKGEQFSADFLALNPLGKVPVMLDPALDRPLAESGAILLWLAERQHELLPADPGRRCEVLQWLMAQMSAIGPMLGQLTHFRLLPEGSEPYSLGRYGAIAAKLYRTLDERLKDRDWLAADEYSVADIATFPWAEYLERHGFAAADYPALARWREKIARRDAVTRAKVRLAESFAVVTRETIGAATQEDLDRFFGRTTSMPARDFTAVKRLQ